MCPYNSRSEPWTQKTGTPPEFVPVPQELSGLPPANRPPWDDGNEVPIFGSKTPIIVRYKAIPVFVASMQLNMLMVTVFSATPAWVGALFRFFLLTKARFYNTHHSCLN
jgi:hypothetical protein